MKKHKKYINCKTYIIDAKGSCGRQHDFTEYTWIEVLDFFNAPCDIDSISELIEWIERDGKECMYLIKEWHEYDKHGFILA